MNGMGLGYPVDFVIQGPSNLDPPLPHKFGFDVNDIREILWDNFILNFLLYYILLLGISKFFKRVRWKL